MDITNIALHSSKLPDKIRNSILQGAGKKFGVKLSLDSKYVIGRGSFGVVVRAESTDPNEKDPCRPLHTKRYAIKMVSCDSTDPEDLEEWAKESKKEANLIQQLQGHPNIWKVFDILRASNHLTKPTPCYMLIKSEIYNKYLHQCIEEVGTI